MSALYLVLREGRTVQVSQYQLVAGAHDPEPALASELSALACVRQSPNLSDVIVDVLVEAQASLLFDLPVDDLAWQLAEVVDPRHPWIVEVRQEKGLSPNVFVQVELLELLVIHDEEVEHMCALAGEEGLGGRAVCVVEPEEEVVIQRLLPMMDLPRLALFAEG